MIKNWKPGETLQVAIFEDTSGWQMPKVNEPGIEHGSMFRVTEWAEVTFEPRDQAEINDEKSKIVDAEIARIEENHKRILAILKQRKIFPIVDSYVDMGGALG